MSRSAADAVLAAGLARPGLADRIEGFIGEFDRVGARRIALALDNGPAWLAADLAALATGRVLVPLAPFFSAEQTRHALEDAGVDTLLVDRSGAGMLDPKRLHFQAVGERDGHVTLCRRPAAPPELPDGTFKISYTSGTTGQPKGACLDAELLGRVAGSLVARTAGIEIERHLALLPMPVLLENVAGGWAGLLRGVDLCMPSLAETGIQGSSGLDAERFAACLDEHRPNSLIVLPALLKAMVMLAESGRLHTASLRLVAVGGAHSPPSLIRRARALGIPVFEGYGMTECGSVVCLNAPGADRPGTVGAPLDHATVSCDSDGQLRVHGGRFLGYVGQPTPSALDDSWPTGDLGDLDADGFVRVQGRIDHRFATSWGRNVSPEWIEARLVAQPEIAQCFVHGRDLDGLVALLVPSHRGADMAQAVARCNAILPDYARIRRWTARARPFDVADGTTTTNGRLKRDAILRQDAEALHELIRTEPETTA